MYALFDKCILFLFCLILFPFDQAAPLCVLAALLAVAVSAGLSAFPGLAGFPVIPTYTLLVCFVPQSALFLPLIAYDAFPSGSEYAQGRRFDASDTVPSGDGCAQERRFDALDTVPSGGEYAQGKRLLSRRAVRIAPVCIAVSLFCVFFRKSLGFRHAFLPYRFQLLCLLFGCLLAALLRWKTDTQLRLRRQLFRTRDDDTELQLLLEERNRSLLEKQDNEIYTATLRERNRIAREIHDNVGHLLTRAILMVGALKASCRDAFSKEPLGQLGDTLDLAMDSIRSSVHDLHDSSVDLEQSLRGMAREFSFCPVALHYQMSPEVPREVKYSLIAITKEALVNISRHSNATSASITVVEHPGFYQFIVQDNGTVPDTQHTEHGESMPGIGLENIRARVDALKGNLQIRTDGGFRLYITIPRAQGEKGALL